MSRTPAVPGYVLVDRLHRGPAADVWRGTRAEDGRPVAVKVPTAGPGGADTAAEAEVLRRVRHPGLVGLLDCVVLDDGRACVVTDLAPGGSLADLVAARGGLTVGETAAVLAPVADALWALHRQGLVHGDVSPGNILFTASGRPLLADLGAAGAPDVLTGTWGTDGFVAAEVLAGERPSAASDVFALGAVAVHALTTQGVSPLEQVDRVVGRCRDAVDVGEPLDALLRSVLAGDPGARPRAVEAARLLEPLADPTLPDVGGRDDAGLVTYRVRALRAPVTAEPAVVPGWRERLGGVGARLRAGGPGRPVVAVVTGAAAVVALGAGAAGLGVAGAGLPDLSLLAGSPGTSGLASAGGAPTAPTAPSAPTAAGRSTPDPAVTTRQGTAQETTRVPGGAGATGSPVVADDPAAQAGGPVRDPGAVLESVLTRRAAAIEQGDERLLDAVDVPGGWAASRDRDILRRMAAAGERPAGLRFVVRDARVVSASATRTLVEASVALDPYRFEQGRGARAAAGAAARREQYELAWTAGRWLVARVAPAT